MNGTGKIIAVLILAGAMTVLSACNNGGGGGAPSSANGAYAMPTQNGTLNTAGGRGYIQPGEYVGVISMSVQTMASPQYGYLMQMLNMQVKSQNFQVTITANGQVPGNARFMIQPMRQQYGYYQAGYGQGVPGIQDMGETAAYTGNGMILTYWGVEQGQCPPGVNCGNNIPDIQIVATVANTPTNSPNSCGGGYGFRPSMNVQIRVKNAIMGSGVLCGGGGGYGYGQQWANRGYYNQYQYGYQRTGY